MYKITLIPGDGVGPEITDVVTRVLEATGISFDWDVQNAGEEVYNNEGTPLPDRVLESIKSNKVAIKGPITTPDVARVWYSRRTPGRPTGKTYPGTPYSWDIGEAVMPSRALTIRSDDDGA